jgi:hypothetical protein
MEEEKVEWPIWCTYYRAPLLSFDRLEIPIEEAEAIEARASEPGLATKRLDVLSYDVPAVVETGAKPLPEADRAGVYTV